MEHKDRGKERGGNRSDGHATSQVINILQSCPLVPALVRIKGLVGGPNTCNMRGCFSPSNLVGRELLTTFGIVFVLYRTSVDWR